MRTLYEVKKGLVLVAAIVASIGLFACGGGGGGSDAPAEVVGQPPANSYKISDFSVGGFSYAWIDESVTPPTITIKLPSDSAMDLSALTPTFVVDSGAVVKVNDVEQVSGTTTINLTTANTTPISYTVSGPDKDPRTYNVTWAKNPKLAQITEFASDYGSPYSQGGKQYVDIVILDKAALGDGWKVLCAYQNGANGYINTLIDSANTAELPTAIKNSLANDDIIRIHANGYAFTDTSAKADDRCNTDRWDVATKNTTFHLWFKNGIVWVEKADGTVVDCVVYKTTAETGWITSANALDKLTLAVKHAQWKSTSKDDAFDLANQAIAFAKLDPAKVTAKADGNAAADWVRDETATILKLTEQKN